MWPTLHEPQSVSEVRALRDYTVEQWDTCLIVFLHNTTDPMERVSVPTVCVPVCVMKIDMNSLQSGYSLQNITQRPHGCRQTCFKDQPTPIENRLG